MRQVRRRNRGELGPSAGSDDADSHVRLFGPPPSAAGRSNNTTRRPTR